MLMEESKKKRLEARVAPETYEILARAAKLQGRTMTGFVVAAAREAAERAIAQYQVIQISISDQERFAAALLNPPPVAPALERAAELHRQIESS